MLLYHGTSARHKEAILKHGLMPRSATGCASNTCLSNPHAVYLSAVAAPIFACGVTPADEVCMMVEVDFSLLNRSLLAPDEDWLMFHDGIKVNDSRHDDLELRRAYLEEMRTRRALWPQSLFHIGAVAYLGRVPVSAITRLVWWPHSFLKSKGWNDFEKLLEEPLRLLEMTNYLMAM